MMKKILLFDTSIATLNLGDEIIMQSVLHGLSDFLNANYCIRHSSHTPPFSFIQRLFGRKMMNLYNNIDYKFVCGTNLLYTNMLRPIPNWNINLFNCQIAKNSILLGVGMGKNSSHVTAYSRLLYKKVLSKEFTHSTRDEKTRKMVEELGLKAINTGCPTLWMLTEEHCKGISHEKSKSVVFTLTHYGYAMNRELDREMIRVLRRNYATLYFWPQCIADLDYLSELGEDENVVVLPANLASYKELLQSDIDYVGNRLHGGIFALQQKKRSIILAIDYRAVEMHRTFNIPCLNRENLSTELENKINSSFETKITGLNLNEINRWMAQFV